MFSLGGLVWNASVEMAATANTAQTNATFLSRDVMVGIEELIIQCSSVEVLTCKVHQLSGCLDTMMR